MKTPRILLAVLTLATLAACGTESVTGPAVPGAARFETTTAESEDTISADGDTEAQTCSGTIVVTTDASGNKVETCVVSDRGPQVGSGS